MTEPHAENEISSLDSKENKVKSDAAQLDMDIIKQIEYYFGDMNLPRDKFLQEQIQLNEGWVPLELMTKFHRLAKLTTDIKVLANALKKSGLMEVNEDSTKIRRSPDYPLPELNEDRRKELQTRTVYVKGFPKDLNVDACIQFFNKYPIVENVLMRKYQDRNTKKWNFKGSVFATFKTKEQAEEFLNLKEVTYESTVLIKKWQKDYMTEKEKEYEIKKEKKGNKRKTEDPVEDEEKNGIKLPNGAILHFTDVPNKMSRENIKEELTKIGAEVAFIDFKVGDKEGWVRLQNENEAKTVFDKMNDGKIKVSDVNIVFKILEGEEEEKFLKKSVEEMYKRRKNNKGKPNTRKGGKKRKIA